MSDKNSDPGDDSDPGKPEDYVDSGTDGPRSDSGNGDKRDAPDDARDAAVPDETDAPVTVASEPDDTDAPAPKRTRKHLSAKSARMVLLFVAAGAIVAAAGTIVLAGGFDNEKHLNTRGAAITPVSTGAVAGDAFGTATAGDCLTWSNDKPTDLTQVDCAQDHRFEVAADIDLSEFPGSEYGPHAPYPKTLRFQELRDQHCLPAVQKYLGQKFDPRGKFSVGLIDPGEAGWQAGERTLRCGLQYSGVAGELFSFTGMVSEQDQSRAWPSGTCIGINQNIPDDPVNCSEPHAFEVTGSVNLAGQFPASAPSVGDQDEYLEQICTKLTADYLGGPEELRNKTLTLFWANRKIESWLAGSTTVSCSVGKQLDSGGFAPVIGSAKGEILINGVAPVPPPPLPPLPAIPLPGPPALPGAPAIPPAGGN